MLRLPKFLYVVALFALTASMAIAQSGPAKAHSSKNQKPPSHGSVLVFTNFTGPGGWDTADGYFVDGADFFDQVLAGGFTPSSTVTFADTALAMGIYTPDGSALNGTARVYLESDAGGIPGTILDGPLAQQNGIRDFQNGFGGNVVQFNCVTCPVLNAGTQYWIVAAQFRAPVEDTWDFSLGDFSSPFAFNQSGAILGGWLSVGSGYTRMAWQVDGN